MTVVIDASVFVASVTDAGEDGASATSTIYVAPYRTHVKGLAIPPEDGHNHTDFTTVWLEARE